MGTNDFPVGSQESGHSRVGGVVTGRGPVQAVTGLVMFHVLIWMMVTQMCLIY